MVLVDDGSTGGTAGILASLGDAIVSVRQANAGKAAALNHGIGLASHPVVVMIDGDTVLEPSSIQNLVARFSDPRIGTIQAMWRNAGAAADGGRASRIKRITIPYLALFQVGMPLLSPLVDLYLLYTLLFVDVGSVITVWAGFLLMQLAAAGLAFAMDRERLASIWFVPTMERGARCQRAV